MSAGCPVVPRCQTSKNGSHAVQMAMCGAQGLSAGLPGTPELSGAQPAQNGSIKR